MPRSVLLGRVVAPGEPLFTYEDTAYAVALAEEERDTCPSCGLPKAWCRDPKMQFGKFVAKEETCFATYALALHQKKVNEGRSAETRSSTQTWASFVEGYQPELEAGLDLPDQGGDEGH